MNTSLSLCSITDLSKRLTICKSNIYDMIDAEQLPPPFSISPKRRAWLTSEIDEWILLKAGGASELELKEFCEYIIHYRRSEMFALIHNRDSHLKETRISQT